MSDQPFERRETFAKKTFNPDMLTPAELGLKEIFLGYFVPCDRARDVDLKPIDQFYIRFADAPNVYYCGFDFKKRYSAGVLKDMKEKGEVCKLNRPVRIEYPKRLWLDSQGNLILALAGGTQDPHPKPIATPQFYE